MGMEASATVLGDGSLLAISGMEAAGPQAQ